MNNSHFIGVVENTLDPLQLGRIQVRIFGFHNDSIAELPTKDLPWAQVVIPITSSGLSGSGSSIQITAGTWVAGFWQDPAEAQHPVILGSLPGYSVRDTSKPVSGFRDPYGIYPKQTREDLPMESRSNFDRSSSFMQKVSSRQIDIPTATPANLSTLDTSKADSYFDPVTWSTPDPMETIRPGYPFNHVTATESGHVVEFDDTPGFERISEFHKSGTYHEIQQDGTTTYMIRGSRNTVIIQGDNVLIKGNSNVTIQGNHRQLVQGDYYLEVNGSYSEKISGSKQVQIGQNLQTEIGQSRAVNITNSDYSLVGDDIRLTVNGSQTIVTRGDFKSTTLGDCDMIGLSGLNITSGSDITITAPDSIDLGAEGINLNTKPTPESNLGMTLNIGNHAVSTGDIRTYGDIISEYGGRQISLNWHVHYDWFDGNNLTTNAVTDRDYTNRA